MGESGIMQWNFIAMALSTAWSTMEAFFHGGVSTAQAIVRYFYTCRHGNAPMEEGRCICPDCGEGIVRVWVELRCAQCGCRRPPRYGGWGQVEAETPCCGHCGHREVLQRQLDRPEYFQVRQALLMVIRPELAGLEPRVTVVVASVEAAMASSSSSNPFPSLYLDCPEPRVQAA